MLPVLKVRLPTADDLLPYLRQIDAGGQYTNDGPLVRELEQRLGGVCVSSATLGLELAAKHVFRCGRVRVPAFTFAATATAVVRAGLEPVFCDIDPDAWAAVPDDRTLAVCPFGFPASGPLVDAAGAWPNVPAGNAVVSLHATKPLAAGEGGVVFGDDGLLDYVRHARNFGMRHGIVAGAGTNAKMSEYHAAVGLASLVLYPSLHAHRDSIASRYADNLAGRVEIRPYRGGTIYPVLVDDPVATAARLARHGFETRRWYCPTLDQHVAFADCRREPLPVTQTIAARLLCLPFHTYMTVADVDTICEVLCES